MITVHAYAIQKKSHQLAPFDYQTGEPGAEEVDIKVESCGICHSDLALIDNEGGVSNYPFVPGHEIIGVVTAMGKEVKNLQIGQRVGLGWFSGSCMHCHHCLRGDQNFCSKLEQTIVGRHGGFADLVRCHAVWAIALPDQLDAKSAGPLFCAGITVFNPLVQFNVRPTQRVGVIGIGGLGHMALQFLNKWGCEVTAFTSSANKATDAKALGAHAVVDSRDSNALAALSGNFDFILNTANANLDWPAFVKALAPRGCLHTVGAVPGPISLQAMQLISGQHSLSGTPLGSPATIEDMLTFCLRHNIQPVTEHFPMQAVNKALDHLRSGKARYRIVLDA